jgi:hypothetical protein
MKIIKNELYELLAFILGIKIYTLIWYLYLKTKVPMSMQHIVIIFCIFLMSGMFGRLGTAVYKSYFLKK